MPRSSLWNLGILAFQAAIVAATWKLSNSLDLGFMAAFVSCFVPAAFGGRIPFATSMLGAAAFAALSLIGIGDATLLTVGTSLPCLGLSWAASYVAALESSRLEEGVNCFSWKHFAGVLPIIGAAVALAYALAWLAHKARRPTLLA